MPIIINDFEIVPEAPAPPDRPADQPKAGPDALRADEMLRLVQRARDRAERLRAY
jgi:hypothetical protein